MAGEYPIHHLGPKRLSWTVAHLFIMADPLGATLLPTVGKKQSTKFVDLPASLRSYKYPS